MSLLRTTILAAIAGIAAICVLVCLGRGTVRAEAEPVGDSAEESDGPPVDEAGVEATPIEPRDWFQPYPADEGALAYDDLSETEQAAADKAAEWADTDSGYAVHQRWASGAVWAREHAQLVIAERNAGLAGSEETGVE